MVRLWTEKKSWRKGEFESDFKVMQPVTLLVATFLVCRVAPSKIMKRNLPRHSCCFPAVYLVWVCNALHSVLASFRLFAKKNKKQKKEKIL